MRWSHSRPLRCIRRARIVAGNIVEQAAAGDDPAGLDPVAIAHAKGLLARLAGADPQHIGRGRVDRVDHRILFFGLPEAVAASRDGEAGCHLDDPIGAGGVHLFLAAEQIVADTGLGCGHEAVDEHVGGARPIGDRRLADPARGGDDDLAIGMDQVRLRQIVAKPLVRGVHRQALAVAVEDQQRALVERAAQRRLAQHPVDQRIERQGRHRNAADQGDLLRRGHGLLQRLTGNSLLQAHAITLPAMLIL